MRLLLALSAITLAGTAVAASAQVHVRGYVRSDGTYVAPHERSAPNGTTEDNWSTKGNVNPYTGQEGTRNPTPTYSPPVYSPPPPVTTYHNPYCTGAYC